MLQCAGSLSTFFDRYNSVTADSARDETTKVGYSSRIVQPLRSFVRIQFVLMCFPHRPNDWKLLVSVQDNLLTLGFWTFLPSGQSASFTSQLRSCMFFQTC